MFRFKKRTDANHKQVASALRDLGFQVKDTHAAADAGLDLIAISRDGVFFVEVKTETGKLRKSQAGFIASNENAVIVCDLKDCVLLKEDSRALRERTIEKVREFEEREARKRDKKKGG